MPERRRRLLLGSTLGLVCLAGWWWWTEPGLPTTLHPGAALLAAALMAAAVALQVVRSAWLFDHLPPLRLARPLLTAHGLNTLLALAGDALELAWLGWHSGLTKVELGLRLALRMGANAVALGGLLLLSWASPPATVVVVLGGLPLAWLARRHGTMLHRAVVQLGLAPLHISLEAAALLACGHALDAPLDLPTAMLGRSGLELATFVPAPLASTGLHHLALSLSSALGPAEISPETVVLHHVLTVATGALALALGAAAGTPLPGPPPTE